MHKLILLLPVLWIVLSPVIRAQEPQRPDPSVAKLDSSGVYRIGNGVSAPKPISMTDPEFPEKLRKHKISGNCKLLLVVDTQGKVSEVRVIHSIADDHPAKLRSDALAMDEKAVEAARQYRFAPALLRGRPVPVAMEVEVNFKIF